MRYPLPTTQPSLGPSLLLTGGGYFKSKTSRRAEGKGEARRRLWPSGARERGETEGKTVLVLVSPSTNLGSCIRDASRRSWHCFWGQED